MTKCAEANSLWFLVVTTHFILLVVRHTHAYALRAEEGRQHCSGFFFFSLFSFFIILPPNIEEHEHVYFG